MMTKGKNNLTQKHKEPLPNLTKEKITSPNMEILPTLKMTSHLQENQKR